jgi:PEP-CTERM motif-containing protein
VIYRSRAVFTLAALAVASAAAATIHWQTSMPDTGCLLCGARDSSGAMLQTSPNADRSTGAGGLGSYARNSTGTYVPGPLMPEMGSDKSGGASPTSRASSAPKGWQPWGSGSGSPRGSSSGSSGPSAPLGGLWRLMSLSRPSHHGNGVATVAVAPANHIKPPAASRPVKAPAPAKPHSSGPGSASAPASTNAGLPATSGSDVPSSGSASSGGAPSTDPFHEHEAPPPDPFRGPGGFNPGAPAGGRAPGGAGGKVSPAPEPGSILLIGTGLLGVLGVLRKRRAL